MSEQTKEAQGTVHRAGIEITEKAAAKIKQTLEQEKKPEGFGLRVGVQGGGCSGLQYVMDLDSARDGDKVFEKDGVKVFVDPKSALYISGSVLDYSESLHGSGFSIKNPNVKSSCGCGHSFTT